MSDAEQPPRSQAAGEQIHVAKSLREFYAHIAKYRIFFRNPQSLGPSGASSFSHTLCITQAR